MKSEKIFELFKTRNSMQAQSFLVFSTSFSNLTYTAGFEIPNILPIRLRGHFIVITVSNELFFILTKF